MKQKQSTLWTLVDKLKKSRRRPRFVEMSEQTPQAGRAAVAGHPDAVPIDAGVGVHATAAPPGDRAADAAPPGAGGGGLRGAAATAVLADGGRALKTRLSIIWAFVPKRASLSLVKHGSRNEVPLAR